MSKCQNSKRIVIFSLAYLPFVGGAELAIKEITDRLAARPLKNSEDFDFEFEMITARLRSALPHTERIGNVLVYRVGPGWGFLDKILAPILGTFKVFLIARKRKIDLFWSVMATYTSFIPFIFNFFRNGKNKIPIVLTLQEGDSEEHIERRHLGLIAFSWRFLLRRADYLTAISNYLLERARHFGYKGNAELVPNGVDVEKFKNKNSEIKITKQNLKFFNDKIGGKVLRDGDKIVITVSRLVEKNGVDILIEAMKNLPENVKLLIVGDGEDREGYEALVREEGLEGKIYFLGLINYTELPGYLHAADVFCRPSRSEGFGSVFIEAFAASVPVVTTQVGGIADFLVPMETGLFAEVNNPKSVAEQIQKLLDDEKLREKIIFNAKNMAQQSYNWDRVAEKMERSLTRVMNLL